jgi:cytochrome c553
MKLPVLLLLAAVAAPAAAQADIAAGKAKAQACAVCHGAQGLSVAPDAPNLAGQPEIYVARQLENYRSGKRPHEVMAVMARPLTDAEIRNLAAYYASIKIEVKP